MFRCLALLLLAAAGAAPVTLPAQAVSPGPLEFLGFRPGSSRAEAERLLASLNGRWTCTVSRTDPRFTDCRGSLRPPGEDPLSLVASLVNGEVAVLMIKGSVGEAGLDRWREHLTTRYGSVSPKRERGQETWQWVRRRRMIRLTTRREDAVRVVSVSLVDGPLLDGLGPVPRARSP